MKAPELFTARFDAAQIHDLNDVSDAIIAMATRAETTLLLLTDLAECTGQGANRETVAIYSAITELNDIQDLTSAYRDHIKQQRQVTPNTDSAGKVAQFVARLRDYANDLEQGGAIE
jgi:hypothetical protein